MASSVLSGEGGALIEIPLPQRRAGLEEDRSSSPDSDRSKMSGYYYPQTSSDEQEFDFNQPFTSPTLPMYPSYPAYTTIGTMSLQAHMSFHTTPSSYYQQPSQYQIPFTMPQQQWMAPTPMVPSNYPSDQASTPFPQFVESSGYQQDTVISGPSRTSTGHLSPDEAGRVRVSRATSFASNASSAASCTENSRSNSPNLDEMRRWGIRNDDGTWSCAYPGCSSVTRFVRGCDLRKHYKRHTKSLFCRWEGCPSATQGGFSSKKDRARHEAKHNPNIVCEFEGCDRLFSRQDNMKDHVRRVHRRRVT